MSRINPIKPKNPWEKVKIFYEKINFYQEIKIFSLSVSLPYSFNFCFLLSISGQFTTDISHQQVVWPSLFQGVDQLSICLRWPPTNPPSSSSSSRDPRTSPSLRGSPSLWGELQCPLLRPLSDIPYLQVQDRQPGREGSVVDWRVCHGLRSRHHQELLPQVFTQGGHY